MFLECTILSALIIRPPGQVLPVGMGQVLPARSHGGSPAYRFPRSFTYLLAWVEGDQ